jgi:membrane-associated phospholipid phosphatase
VKNFSHPPTPPRAEGTGMSHVKKLSYILIAIVFYMLGYAIIQSMVHVGKFDFYTQLDSLIPLVPEFIWIYHSVIPILFITMVVLVRDKNLFFSMFWSCLVSSIILNLSYALLPSFYPRENFALNTIHDYLLQFTRELDGAHNTFPSGHVTFSWLITLTALKTRQVAANRSLCLIYIFWAICVTLSTLTLKQHFIVDTLSGFFLSCFVFYSVNHLMSSRLSLFTSDEVPHARGQ